MTRWVWVVLAVGLALLVRIPAAAGLAQDADEPIYLRVATAHAQAMRAGQWSSLMQPTDNAEHPALIKLMNGAGIAALGDNPSLVQRLGVARGLSIMGGALLAGLLAWVHPVAGVALASHTLHAKYTSQGYLDAWPLLWMFAALLMWRRGLDDGRARWVIGFGLLWGLAASGKVLHALPGLLMALHWGRRCPRRLGWLVGLPVCTFFLLNPPLWLDVVGGLQGMFVHHAEYAQGLQDAGWVTQWWAPLAHLGSAGPAAWHPDVFHASADGWILVLGGLGMCIAAGRSGPQQPLARMVLAWFVGTLALLALWPTRWPQHALLLVPPICLGVGWFAQFFGAVFSRASRRSGSNG